MTDNMTDNQHPTAHHGAIGDLSGGMSDDEFARAFLAGAIPPDRFHHRDHLRLAWCLIGERGAEEAATAIASAIQRYAADHGQAAKYHETLTRFWVRLVAHARATRPDLAPFERFIADFPWLLDKTLPYRHWTHAAMDGPAARARWVEPDLLALPA